MRRPLPPLLAALALTLGTTPTRAATLVEYDSKYYTLYTDVGPKLAQEATLRMTRMAEEYRDRTRGFAGQITHKFPFYLYSEAADYYAAGGLKGSAGVFSSRGDQGKLMAIAGHRPSAYTWHTVQHEGFHQFAHAVIGGDLPTWLNEGLAEYFGEALYTGDGFVVGIVPPWRLDRLKRELSGDQLQSVDALMAVTPQQWQAQMNIRNYDQAWSMVHFLVHADAGRYAPALSKCIREAAAGKPFDDAWADAIGPTAGFQDRYKTYWLAQPASPTAPLYDQATVATLTSFLARSYAQKQTFPTVAAFAAAAANPDGLKLSPDDWLPPSLLANALRTAALTPPPSDEADAPDPAVPTRLTHWEIKPGVGRRPTLSAAEPDGTRLTGWFTVAGPHVAAVNVEVDDLPRTIAAATAVRDAGKKASALALVQAALRQHPRSAAADDARKFIRSCR